MPRLSVAVSLAWCCEGHGSTPDVGLCSGPIVLPKPPPLASSLETGRGQGVPATRSQSGFVASTRLGAPSPQHSQFAGDHGHTRDDDSGQEKALETAAGPRPVPSQGARE